jgi:hypothetical protein
MTSITTCAATMAPPGQKAGPHQTAHFQTPWHVQNQSLAEQLVQVLQLLLLLLQLSVLLVLMLVPQQLVQVLQLLLLLLQLSVLLVLMLVPHMCRDSHSDVPRQTAQPQCCHTSCHPRLILLNATARVPMIRARASS